MEAREKLEVLGRAAQYDICFYNCGSPSRGRSVSGKWIYPAILPNGRTVKLLKVLLTNFCEKNCFYCVNRRNRDFPRVSFTPEELAKIFVYYYQHRLAEGLFLSSAISVNTVTTMEKMLKTVEILRYNYRFPGYIHLKILPGAGYDYVSRAVELASRVSLNLESPNAHRLQRICPEKRYYEDLLLRLKWANTLRNSPQILPAGITTQLVVGAAGENDQEILTTTYQLYQEIDLSRTYFSAFQPVENTPLENLPPVSPVREHRLYQVDYLFRKYGFRLEEIFFDRQGNLPHEQDPKMVWALNHPERFPVELNLAEREELLRIPGIGPVTASRILRLRRERSINSLEQLQKIRVVVKRAAPFVLINGHPPVSREWGQLIFPFHQTKVYPLAATG